MTELPTPQVRPLTPAAGYPTEVRERLVADARDIIARYPEPRSGLLPMLHLVQAEDGYVSPDGILFCAEMLNLTAAEVSAVATFYTQYKAHPNGTYTVGVCINTLCAVMGGDEIYDAVSDHLGVGHDETTADGAITLEKLECNAACDFAPVVMVNWEFFDNQTPESARALVDELRSGNAVTPTRGANRVCTFKEVSRVLAGFEDGRADEGVGAGDPSLEGVRLARREGWHAPEMASRPLRGGDSARRSGADSTASDAAAADQMKRGSYSSAEAPGGTVETDTGQHGDPTRDADPGPDSSGSDAAGRGESGADAPDSEAPGDDASGEKG